MQDLREVLVSRLEPAGILLMQPPAEAAHLVLDVWPCRDARDFASTTDNCMRPSCFLGRGSSLLPRQSYIGALCIHLIELNLGWAPLPLASGRASASPYFCSKQDKRMDKKRDS